MPALKLLAACVCPIAGTIGVTVAVPPVKRAVHRITAPAPRREVVAPPVSVIPAEAPCQIVTSPIEMPPLGALSVPESALDGGVRIGATTAYPSVVHVAPIAIAPIQPITPPAVPEPQMWAAMTLGFGVVGVAIRKQRRAAA